MYLKIVAGICAVSSSITAIFCIWIAVNMFACNHEAEKMIQGMDQSSSGSPTSEAQMEKERLEILRQLNSRSGK